MAKNFRTYFYKATPSWQHTGEGEGVLWSLSRLVDAFITWSKQATYARFPTKAGPSANAITGRERGIAQGRRETQAHYATRLTNFRYPRGHRVRGNAFAALNEIFEYFGGLRCYIVTERRSVSMRGATAVYLTDSPTYSADTELTVYNYENWFSWDGKDSDVYWSRFLVYLTPNPQIPTIQQTPDFGDAALWGGAIGTPGFVIGMTDWTPDDTAAMRRLFYGRRQWKPSLTRALWMLVQLTPWADGFATGDGPPTWEHWSYQNSGVRRAARSDVYRYICLSPGLNQYAGNPAQWTPLFVLPDGVTEYAGNAASFPNTITLPTGVSYAGNPASFPAVIQLVDDGDSAR